MQSNYGFLWEKPERLSSHPPPWFLSNRIREARFHQHLLHISVFRLHHQRAVQCPSYLRDRFQPQLALGQIRRHLQPGRHRRGAQLVHHPRYDQVVLGERQLRRLRPVPVADVHLLRLSVARVVRAGDTRLRPVNRDMLPAASALDQHAAQHVLRRGGHVVLLDSDRAFRHLDHEETVVLQLCPSVQLLL